MKDQKKKKKKKQAKQRLWLLVSLEKENNKNI